MLKWIFGDSTKRINDLVNEVALLKGLLKQAKVDYRFVCDMNRDLGAALRKAEAKVHAREAALAKNNAKRKAARLAARNG